MGLKQSVVIVNEYTIKTGDKGGTRGGTPGDYVLRYMARVGATEDITPTKLQEFDTNLTKYIARERATNLFDDIPSMKQSMRNAQRYGGVAFGYGDVALSDARLKRVSKDIQSQFDAGKTVMKTVLSFDEEYLREHGLISKDFHCRKRGDFRGHIDQLKLRMAIMNGMEKLSRHYDDLQFVGVIQVDTKHVHCHLAMVDRGRGSLMPDGTQRGKLTEKEKLSIRRGVDMYLDAKQTVKMMSSSVVYDKRNALCYIKKRTHQMMAQQGFSQFLLACLPENRNLWRASTNRKEMRKANSLVRDYVVQLLEQPQSGYRDAMNSVIAYADYRRDREDLSSDEHAQLIRDGQERIVTECMNGVYAVVKQIPESERQVRTPMLEMMSQDYEDMAAQAVNDPLIEFGFKLRSYASRLDFHRKEYHRFESYHEQYEQAETHTKDAEALDAYFQLEMRYNQMLMVKYQYFLSFLPPDEKMEEEFEALMEQKDRLRNLRMMSEDKAFQRMLPENAEEYGIRVYGQYGGRRVKVQPEVIATRIRNMEQDVFDQEQRFRKKLQDYGMDYDGSAVVRRKLYPFEDVKALDLHHITYDFATDVPVSKPYLDEFVKMANERYDAFQKAKLYLEGTGQHTELESLPEQDVMVMKEYADRFGTTGILPSSRKAGSQFRQSRTVRLGKNYERDLQMAVHAAVASMPSFMD